MTQRLILRHGDCVEVLKGYEDGSIGAIISDPPYGLKFMGMGWDSLDGRGKSGATEVDRSRSFDRIGGNHNPTSAPDAARTRRIENQKQQRWHDAWLTEVYRVLRPGGVVKAFSGTRTFHRMAAAMAEAGFVGLRVESWNYGSGFPKSMNISKALDKVAGTDAEKQAAVQAYLRESREAKGMSKREVDVAVFGGTTRYGWVEGRGGARANEVYLPTPEEWEVLKGVLDLDDRFDAYIKAAIPSRKDRFRADGGKAIQLGTEEGDWGYQQGGDRWGGERTLTAPATAAAHQWDGWGTALKPSWEPVVVGRKPE